MRRFNTFTIASFLTGMFLAVSVLRAQEEAPKNIILLIGDGMGVGQLTVMKTMLGDMSLDAFPVGGLMTTSSLDNFITCSAAAGTALSTGYLTDNGMVALAPDGSSLLTLLEAARDRGKAVGVVATSSVTHATPASFLSHVPRRSQQFEIAIQMASSGADVIVGGGRRFFLPEGEDGGRKDGANLIAEMRQAGYTYAEAHAPELPDEGKLLWLLADDALPRADERPYGLGELVEVSISLLSQREEGFVLMVEGSQIDWAGHSNDIAMLRAELGDFEGAITAALAFAERDQRTLLLVTADHETGGLSVVGTAADGSDMEGKWIWDDHTADMVPLFAYGPSSAIFGGLHSIDHVGRLLHSLLLP
ncbi:MAG: alkaline phosphatase [Bacteroidetes bacterium]|nr:alkaline phosphatase [Bacteroidota bacterium]